MTSDPIGEYTSRANARRAAQAAHKAQSMRISRLRLLIFGIGVGAAVLVWRGSIGSPWLLLLVPAFIGLVVWHDRVLRACDRAARAAAFYERGLARIGDRWIGTGATGDRFREDAHPYSADLDIFGAGSLFELLSIARTRTGEDTLAGWLRQPADRAELLDRHEAVRELTGALDLREALSVSGRDAAVGLDAEELRAWAEAPRFLDAWRQQAAVALTLALIASIAVFAITEYYLPLVVVLSAQAWFQMRQRPRVEAVLHGADRRSRDLSTLIDLLEEVERQTFTSPRLVALQRRIVSGGTTASSLVTRLQRLIAAHDWEHNMIFAPIALLLMWSTHVAALVEHWRLRHGYRVLDWLEAVGDIEAFASLSAYRYEHPLDPFPDLVEPDGRTPALFEGTELGHPLLPSARMVRNDVRLDHDSALLIVSGSNMSGKSTLLRTVGINAVLALAGAPVRAASLRLSPVAIGATLRIQDSLQEGRSRFYAEITRIRSIVDRAGDGPLLFLLDELFHGTNSHDRLVGASGVLRRLLDLGAVGLITTHDLALTAVADQLAPRAKNVHFEDRFESGEMLFDYRMKGGPVTRSNALALMRAVGLDV